MRQFDPNDEDDVQTVADERILPWMLACIARNPDYVHWGPGEDYMATKGDGWSSSQSAETWAAFGPWALDELNECVNFYFYAERDFKKCEACDGDGLNAASHRVSEDFYDFSNTGRKWCDRITQDEVQALVDAERLTDFVKTWTPASGWQRDPSKPIPTDEQVNAWERGDRSIASGFGHDAISRWILIETRCKRLGVWGKCSDCEGRGSLWTTETARLGLVVWMLHPRKGASRGVDVKNIQESEVPAVLAWLRTAAERNAMRFAGAMRTP